MDFKDLAALFFSASAFFISVFNFCRSFTSERAVEYLRINQRRLNLLAKATTAEVASRSARRILTALQIETANEGRLTDFPQIKKFIQSYTEQIEKIGPFKLELGKRIPMDRKSRTAFEQVMDGIETFFNSELPEAEAEDYAQLVRNNMKLQRDVKKLDSN